MRIVPALDRWPRAVAFASTPIGRLALVAAFTLGLRLHAVRWWGGAGVALAALALFPRRRRELLAFATLAWAVTWTRFDWSALDVAAERMGHLAPEWTSSTAFRFATVLAGWALAIGAREWIRARTRAAPQGLCARRPIACLILADALLLAIAAHAPLPSGLSACLWALVIVTGRLLWYVALSLLDRSNGSLHATGTSFGTWLPFWTNTTDTATPIPKNGAMLARIEAKNDDELAVTMLKGVKLLAWSIVLAVVADLFAWAVHAEPGRLTGRLFAAAIAAGRAPLTLALPHVETAFVAVASGASPGAAELWTISLANFFEDLLAISIWGHVMVAGARMAGFRALRNTWRPLESRTIAEFWNRYFFYFKELLVDVFFYPAFLRGPKRHPRLRRFLATVAAAGVGNFVYHFLKEFHLIAEHGLPRALVHYQAYAAYGLVLGSAIGLSQLRDARAKRTWTAPIGVCLFYALVIITRPTRPIAEHVEFLRALLGLGGVLG